MGFDIPIYTRLREDGLFSRNLYYCYDRKLEWIDPTPCNDCPDLEKHFMELSGKVAKVKKVLEKKESVSCVVLMSGFMKIGTWEFTLPVAHSSVFRY